jgi:ATP-independent RNA helicase DbpA
MLDMGFEDEIQAILAYAPKERQTLLFSATYADEIRKISKKFQRNPVSISIDTEHQNEAIKQSFYLVEPSKKINAVGYLLSHHQPESTVIFCNTKKDCHDVAYALSEIGFSVQSLHGDLEQKERNQVLVRFANKSCSVLIATDVAARGLDIKDLQAVINYELPWDPEVYIHRIGRTGRAGKTGLALNLCSAREQDRVKEIEAYQKLAVHWDKVQPFQMKYEQRQDAPMTTLWLGGGRKNKVRPGDILGALTGDKGIEGSHVGKINVFDTHAYVAIKRESADKALACLKSGRIKGKRFNVHQSEG